MKEFQITENEAGQRFDKYLAKLLRNAPKSFFYKMLRKKNITLNGRKATGNEKLNTGDQIRLFLSDETFSKFSQQEQTARAVTDLDIIYEDTDILLINKPAGMLSQPDDTKEPSMVEYLIGYLLQNGSLTEENLRTFHPSYATVWTKIQAVLSQPENLVQDCRNCQCYFMTVPFIKTIYASLRESLSARGISVDICIKMQT